MRTILVTGGAGFIGSCLVRHLVDCGDFRIINLDKLTYAGNRDSLATVLGNPQHVFVEGNIADARLVARLLAEHRPSAVVNLAAESHVDRSIDAPAAFVQTNVVGTCVLLDTAREYWRHLPDEERRRFRFVHVSTDEVYGSLRPEGKFTESSPYAPRSPYSASKAASDHFVRAYYHTFGLPVCITNSSNNYGPYQFPEKMVPLMILNALEGRPLPVYGDGGNVRDWLFVEDHVRALAAVVDRGRPGETYNIGGNCERTNLELVRAICETVDRLRPDLPHVPTARLITHVADRPGHDRRYAIDASKIGRDLHWKAQVELPDGLQQTVRWYLDSGSWVERVTSGKYRRERLGLATKADADSGKT